MKLSCNISSGSNKAGIFCDFRREVGSPVHISLACGKLHKALNSL